MLIGLREAGEAGPQELRVRRFANLSCSAFHRQGTLYSAMSMFLSRLVRALRSLCAPGSACNEFPWNAPPAPFPFHLPFYFKSDSAKTDTRGTVALWHEYHSLFNSEQ